MSRSWVFYSTITKLSHKVKVSYKASLKKIIIKIRKLENIFRKLCVTQHPTNSCWSLSLSRKKEKKWNIPRKPTALQKNSLGRRMGFSFKLALAWFVKKKKSVLAATPRCEVAFIFNLFIGLSQRRRLRVACGVSKPQSTFHLFFLILVTWKGSLIMFILLNA